MPLANESMTRTPTESVMLPAGSPSCDSPFVVRIEAGGPGAIVMGSASETTPPDDADTEATPTGPTEVASPADDTVSRLSFELAKVIFCPVTGEPFASRATADKRTLRPAWTGAVLAALRLTLATTAGGWNEVVSAAPPQPATRSANAESSPARAPAAMATAHAVA